jgi:hypothetical protein
MGLATGLGLAGPVEALVGMMLVTPVILALAGSVFGASQWLAVWKWHRAGVGWIVASAVALAVGMTLGIVVVELAGRAITGEQVRLFSIDPVGRVLSLAVVGTLTGLAVGAAQRLALRPYRTAPGSWVVRCAAAFWGGPTQWGAGSRSTARWAAKHRRICHVSRSDWSDRGYSHRTGCGANYPGAGRIERRLTWRSPAGPYAPAGDRQAVGRHERRAVAESDVAQFSDPPRGGHRRASRIRLNGVSAARRKCVNPAVRNTSARRASPACAPRTRCPPSEIACAQQSVVEAA